MNSTNVICKCDYNRGISEVITSPKTACVFLDYWFTPFMYKYMIKIFGIKVWILVKLNYKVIVFVYDIHMVHHYICRNQNSLIF